MLFDVGGTGDCEDRVGEIRPFDVFICAADDVVVLSVRSDRISNCWRWRRRHGSAHRHDFDERRWTHHHPQHHIENSHRRNCHCKFDIDLFHWHLFWWIFQSYCIYFHRYWYWFCVLVSKRAWWTGWNSRGAEDHRSEWRGSHRPR